MGNSRSILRRWIPAENKLRSKAGAEMFLREESNSRDCFKYRALFGRLIPTNNKLRQLYVTTDTLESKKINYV